MEGSRGRLSTTEKVRMKGLVERTRVIVVEVGGKGTSITDAESPTQLPDDTEDESMKDDNDTMDGELEIGGNHGRWEMEIARVYEKTIIELGVSLDASGAGGLF